MQSPLSLEVANAGRAGDAGPATLQPPACYLLLHSVAKKHNIGTLARCATAFGVTAICLIGGRHFNAFGSHGSIDHVALLHYATLEDCCEDLRRNKGCRIVGVEIMDNARPVQSHPFSGPSAFMLGNEGQGLSERQLRLCDSFVYIPQFGPGTASLNVACAASIVLHHFATWAGYSERPREGQKFVVDERPQRTQARGCVPLTPEEAAAERERRAAVAAAACSDDDGSNLPCLFD